VSVSTAMIATALSMAVCVGLGNAVGNRTAVLAGVAIPFSLLVAALLLQRCIRRFGGITGDVLGALVETATAAALLVLASH
jgi:adenosylcobinamide-GDP ribazoletransferase